MDEVTRIERRLDRIEALVEGIARGLIGKSKRDEWVRYWESDEQVKAREFERRWTEEHPIYKAGITHKEVTAIEHVMCDDPYFALVTLEDLVIRRREEVAGIRGVGPRTMTRLDSALAERGLTWAEAV